jgi:tRNA threonylcarbamoyladenosine biosynthesis protein TsaB
MLLLAIERSTESQSVALVRRDDGADSVAARVFAGENSRSADWPLKVRGFLAENNVTFADLDRIVVGVGPGSFAGIRAALSFAQGVALGGKAKVYGLPSAAALALDGVKTAVVGDARRGLYWVVVYSASQTLVDFHLVAKEQLSGDIPEDAKVVTPDGARIGSLLESVFGDRYRGNMTPLAERIARIAVADPERLVPEPLPVYLSPAVRV